MQETPSVFIVSKSACSVWHRTQLTSFTTNMYISVHTYSITFIDLFIVSHDLCSNWSRYHISTPLLLSEMEHAVRRVFVSVNNCPHRLLTAEVSIMLSDDVIIVTIYIVYPALHYI